jgi:hypothetical protein
VFHAKLQGCKAGDVEDKTVATLISSIFLIKISHHGPQEADVHGQWREP